jgi:hypothetical protein
MDLRESWQFLARELGVVDKPGLQGFVDAPRLISMVGSEIRLFKNWERKAAFLDNRLFAAVAEKLHPGMAFGDWQGYRCALFPAGRAHSTSSACTGPPRSSGSPTRASGTGARVRPWIPGPPPACST